MHSRYSRSFSSGHCISRRIVKGNIVPHNVSEKSPMELVQCEFGAMLQQSVTFCLTQLYGNLGYRVNVDDIEKTERCKVFGYRLTLVGSKFYSSLQSNFFLLV